MRVLGTFQSRDAADSVRDLLIKDGYNAADLIVMANQEAAEPPESADLEVGTAGEGGFKEFEEKVGKAVLSLMGKEEKLEGDGFEGPAKGGALLGVTVRTQAEGERAAALLRRHFAGDVEVAEAD